MTFDEWEIFFDQLTFDSFATLNEILGTGIRQDTSYREDYEGLSEHLAAMDLKTFCISYLLLGGTLAPEWLDIIDNMEYTTE